jgi:hypothetical protein
MYLNNSVSMDGYYEAKIIRGELTLSNVHILMTEEQLPMQMGNLQ